MFNLSCHSFKSTFYLPNNTYDLYLLKYTVISSALTKFAKATEKFDCEIVTTEQSEKPFTLDIFTIISFIPIPMVLPSDWISLSTR